MRACLPELVYRERSRLEKGHSRARGSFARQLVFLVSRQPDSVAHASKAREWLKKGIMWIECFHFVKADTRLTDPDLTWMSRVTA